MGGCLGFFFLPKKILLKKSNLFEKFDHFIYDSKRTVDEILSDSLFQEELANSQWFPLNIKSEQKGNLPHLRAMSNIYLKGL